MYSVWFRDELAEPEDEDREWVACFDIEADTPDLAKSWGDHLANAFCSRHLENVFLWSGVRSPDDPYWEGVDPRFVLPLVRYGEEVSDEYIGW